MSLVSAVASVGSRVIPLLTDNSATFIIPGFELGKVDLEAPDPILVVKGVFSQGATEILIENSNGDQFTGMIREGCGTVIDGNLYTVDVGSRVDNSILSLKLTSGLLGGLVGGESVSSSDRRINVTSTVEISTESYNTRQTDGVALFGFQYMTRDFSVVPKVGWYCRRGVYSGYIIEVEQVRVTIVWVGKKGISK